MSDKGEAYEGWAIVELMGHRRLGGQVSQAEQYGTVMLRIDVPRADGSATTHFFGGSSLYGVHPTTEEMARMVAERNDPSPVQRWELQPPVLMPDGAPPVDDDAHADEEYAKRSEYLRCHVCDEDYAWCTCDGATS